MVTLVQREKVRQYFMMYSLSFRQLKFFFYRLDTFLFIKLVVRGVHTSFFFLQQTLLINRHTK